MSFASAMVTFALEMLERLTLSVAPIFDTFTDRLDVRLTTLSARIERRRAGRSTLSLGAIASDEDENVGDRLGSFLASRFSQYATLQSLYDWLSLAEVQSGLAAAGSLLVLVFVLWRMNVARSGDGLALMEGFVWSLLAVPIFALVCVCVGRFARMLAVQHFPQWFDGELSSTISSSDIFND